MFFVPFIEAHKICSPLTPYLQQLTCLYILYLCLYVIFSLFWPYSHFVPYISLFLPSSVIPIVFCLWLSIQIRTYNLLYSIFISTYIIFYVFHFLPPAFAILLPRSSLLNPLFIDLFLSCLQLTLSIPLSLVRRKLLPGRWPCNCNPGTRRMEVLRSHSVLSKTSNTLEIAKTH